METICKGTRSLNGTFKGPSRGLCGTLDETQRNLKGTLKNHKQELKRNHQMKRNKQTLRGILGGSLPTQPYFYIIPPLYPRSLPPTTVFSGSPTSIESYRYTPRRSVHDVFSGSPASTESYRCTPQPSPTTVFSGSRTSIESYRYTPQPSPHDSLLRQPYFYRILPLYPAAFPPRQSSQAALLR